MIRDFADNDTVAVKALLFKLQKFLINEDSIGLLKHFNDDGSEYFDNLLNTVREQSGKIFICEVDSKVVGLVAGYIDEVDKVDQLMTTIQKPGYIAELFVEESYRGKGYGQMLMSEMEKYFVEQGCDVITVTVDGFNSGARQMYTRTGYAENDIVLLKRVNYGE